MVRHFHFLLLQGSRPRSGEACEVKRLLLVGIPPEVGGWLESQLDGLQVRVARDASETVEALRAQTYDLLLVDHDVPPIQGLGLLEQLKEAISPLPPIYYSIPDLRDFALMFRLSQEFQVKRFLTHPLEPEDLLRRLAEQLKLVPGRRSTAAPSGPEISGPLRKIWDKHWPSLKQKAESLVLVDHELLGDPERRQEVQRCAHQLAGTVGSFGLQRATDLSREIEQELISNARVEPEFIVSRGLEIARLLGVSPPLAVASVAPLPESEAVDSVWLGRLRTLEGLAVALSSGAVPSLQWEEALADARRLRIAAEVFRWSALRQMALEVERLLASRTLNRDQAGYLAERILEMQKEVGRHAPERQPLSGRCLTWVGRPRSFWNELALALQLQGLQCQTLPLERAGEVRSDVAIVAVDRSQLVLSFEAMARLCKSEIPVLVFCEQLTLQDRLRATELGVSGFLEDGTLVSEEILERIRHLLQQQSGSGMRILAVDDDPVLLRILSKTLSSAGYQVTTEQEPLLFWERLQEVDPDLIILDVDMPHLSGIDLCRVLRNHARWGGVPVLFLTAERNPQVVEQIFGAGGDDYVLKPLVGNELLSRIRQRWQRFVRTWEAVQSGYQGDSRALEPRLEWMLQVSQRFEQPLALVFLRFHSSEGEAPARFHEAEQRLRFLAQPGDVVARWDASTLLIAMLACSRQQARERLQEAELGSFLGQTALVAFPADAFELETLLERGRKLLESQPTPTPGATPASSNQGTYGCDVLLVDDDPTLTEMVQAVLAPQGYSLVTADSLEGAQRQVAPEDGSPGLVPRVILLDVNLGEADGYTLLQQWSEKGLLDLSRVIMLTGEANSQKMVFRAIEAGAFDYVAKPFQDFVLLGRVKRAWQSTQASA